MTYDEFTREIEKLNGERNKINDVESELRRERLASICPFKDGDTATVKLKRSYTEHWGKKRTLLAREEHDVVIRYWPSLTRLGKTANVSLDFGGGLITSFNTNDFVWV